MTNEFHTPGVGLCRTSIKIGWAHATITAMLLLGWMPADAQAPIEPGAPAAVQIADAISDVVWSWSGGVTDTQAVVVAQIQQDAPLLLLESGVANANKPITVVPQSRAAAGDRKVWRYEMRNLAPDTIYNYRFMGADGKEIGLQKRSFKTFPVSGKPASFRFVVSSCAYGKDPPTYAAALQQRPLFFMHTGDFHYMNIVANDVAPFWDAFTENLRAPNLNRLLQSVPMAYVWDDHDFGPNDSNRNSPSKPAAHHVYRNLVPHYPLTDAGETTPIDQAFSVGRARFILSDLRSERDPATQAMISAAQMEWLKKELLATKGKFPLVFWVSSVSWNGAPGGGDRWQGYSRQRTEIADFIKANGIENVCVLAGDAHMTAIDDGTNSDFATGGGAPIRVFQAGPIHTNGSYKGGPYSHGAKSSGQLQQFGVVDIEDDSKQITVKWSGREGSDGIGNQVLVAQKDGDKPIEYTFRIAANP